jgi:hypothetical protein
MLDDKLSEHVSVYGTTAPVNITDTVSHVQVHQQTKCKVTISSGSGCQAKKEKSKLTLFCHDSQIFIITLIQHIEMNFLAF